ncbi:MAG TPA: aminotransferase class I/II-fold pyridoxal phosphate-dependent enzyme [Chloroflexota bacterium]|nr:aminotransferase class I/II-fold pyridoxal phosphate-dependent enzyme [Chloroflexota bacterium]
MDDWHFDTRSVHAGRNQGPLQDPNEPRPDGLGTPVVPGIQPSSAYYFDSLDSLDRAFDDPTKGFVYARHGGQTGGLFGEAIADLEGADGAVAFSSGMAAVHAALLASEPSKPRGILASRDLYGATQALLTNLFAPQGIPIRLVDTTELGAVRDALGEGPRLLYVETISNPLMRLADLAVLADLAHGAGAHLIVDNTFASPYLCRPIEHGADAVVHSATKYLGGHGDLTAGVVAAQADLLPALGLVSRLVGGTLGAFDAWLALRGLRTLSLRLERQCANALALARALRDHPRIARVHYPGLGDHAQHALARRLFADRGFSGMLSFELAGAEVRQVRAFMDALNLLLPAPTMGDVYSLALYPAQASHRGLSPEQRAALGIGDNLVRISCGIESPDDIIADVLQALDAAR